MKLGVVTGVLREAHCLQNGMDMANVMVRCAGARPEYAEKCATDLLAEGCSALISFGIAGGLAPALSAGQVVVADRVVTPSKREIPTSDNWRERLVSALPRNGTIVMGAVAGSENIVLDPDAKQNMFSDTGAIAVDMESHRVALVAAEAGVPLMVVRAVCDAADQTIPRSAVGAINENGAPHYGKVIVGLCKRPSDLPKLMRLSKDSESAFASLRRVASVAGVLFRFA